MTNKIPVKLLKNSVWGEKRSDQVQHQRRVNPKIHDVIKNEVEKLLDAGLILPYPMSMGQPDTLGAQKVDLRCFINEEK
ncbi:hypothetical protein Tco_1473463 [Tanacetum coccineum]